MLKPCTVCRDMSRGSAWGELRLYCSRSWAAQHCLNHNSYNWGHANGDKNLSTLHPSQATDAWHLGHSPSAGSLLPGKREVVWTVGSCRWFYLIQQKVLGDWGSGIFFSRLACVLGTSSFPLSLLVSFVGHQWLTVSQQLQTKKHTLGFFLILQCSKSCIR